MLSLYPSKYDLEILWSSIKCSIKEYFRYDVSDAVDYLKNYVIMSLYLSLEFHLLPPTNTQMIFNNLVDVHPELNNPDSALSKSQSLAHRKKDCKDAYMPGNTSVLLSGQLFDCNAAMYFSQYWNSPDNTIKCFDSNEFIKYLEHSSEWPYHPNNLHGMYFKNYFKLIQELHDTLFKDTTPNLKYVRSLYLFEQLFSPVSFIQNVHLHISSFYDIFYKTKLPDREKSILLMRPLFKLPPKLWETVSDNYISAIKNYIDQPRDISAYTLLQAHMSIVIYYRQFLFPLLKIVLGHCLYSSCNTDIQKCRDILKSHIESNIKLFYDSVFVQGSLDSVSNIDYPQNKTIKNSKSHNIASPRTDNNNALNSYDINFTHAFFCSPEPNDFFSYTNLYGSVDIHTFVHNTVSFYIEPTVLIQNSETTSNYLQVLAKKFNFPKGMII
jgi:hypothetical protein